MIEPIQPAGWKPRRPPVSRPNRNPPTTEPITPSTIVRSRPMSSLPGTIARAMKPAIRPNRIQPRMVMTMVLLLRGSPDRLARLRWGGGRRAPHVGGDERADRGQVAGHDQGQPGQRG